jgi:hypothetical protein
MSGKTRFFAILAILLSVWIGDAWLRKSSALSRLHAACLVEMQAAYKARNMDPKQRTGPACACIRNVAGAHLSLFAYLRYAGDAPDMAGSAFDRQFATRHAALLQAFNQQCLGIAK